MTDDFLPFPEDYDDDEGLSRYDPEDAPLCDCGRTGDDACGCCGAPLCFVCAETQAGFCAGMRCATEERLATMEKALRGEEAP